MAVDVTGIADSEGVARGRAALEDAGACVCFALVAEEPAVCAGVGCVVDDAERCRFVDEAGGLLTARTVTFGDGGGLPGVVDTHLLALQPTRRWDDQPVISIESPDRRVGRLRFDVTALPPTSLIDEARLELVACVDVACRTETPVAAFALLESWGGEASWQERRTGTAWLGPGASGASRSPAPVATLDAVVDGRQALDVTDVVAGWVADPASNHGLVLELDSTMPHTAAFVSSDAPVLDDRPRLVVTYRLP